EAGSRRRHPIAPAASASSAAASGGGRSRRPILAEASSGLLSHIRHDRVDSYQLIGDFASTTTPRPVGGRLRLTAPRAEIIRAAPGRCRRTAPGLSLNADAAAVAAAAAAAAAAAGRSPMSHRQQLQPRQVDHGVAAPGWSLYGDYLSEGCGVRAVILVFNCRFHTVILACSHCRFHTVILAVHIAISLPPSGGNYRHSHNNSYQAAVSDTETDPTGATSRWTDFNERSSAACPTASARSSSPCTKTSTTAAAALAASGSASKTAPQSVFHSPDTSCEFATRMKLHYTAIRHCYSLFFINFRYSFVLMQFYFIFMFISYCSLF
uniref:Os06g0165000 protein n=1 Tax=Macrostomum lignano TaxID=282301 RepID=A0A1I8JQT1_9PLAT